jgi:hypothetical protein
MARAIIEPHAPHQWERDFALGPLLQQQSVLCVK